MITSQEGFFQHHHGVPRECSGSVPGLFRDCSGVFRRGATHQAAFRSLALAAFSRILAFAMLRQSNGFAQAPFCSLVLVTICNIVMFAVSRQSEGFAEAPFCSLELAAFSRIVMFAIERQSSGFAVACFCSYAPAMTFRIT